MIMSLKMINGLKEAFQPTTRCTFISTSSCNINPIETVIIIKHKTRGENYPFENLQKPPDLKQIMMGLGPAHLFKSLIHHGLTHVILLYSIYIFWDPQIFLVPNVLSFSNQRWRH
jgi:hypothetical protein